MIMRSFPLFFITFLIYVRLNRAQLSADFYQTTTCPNAEAIVSSSILSQAKEDNVIAPSMLRLFAHDCFVQGCDASILITSTSGNERQFSDNQNFPQNPFDAITKAKQAVESACPGIVSCADILAIAARDAVVSLGGPTWEVLKGRRDGLVSQASLAAGRLPGADFDVSELISNFGAVDLSPADLVALSGAHTIGFSHCDQFSNRLYNFGGSSDPSMSPSFVTTLKEQCPRSLQGNPNNVVQAFDISTPFVFDNLYFSHLLRGEGLLTSDNALITDSSTRGLVMQFSQDQSTFFQAFVSSMIKMGSIGVKTGSEGEIRRDCSKFNSE